MYIKEVWLVTPLSYEIKLNYQHQEHLKEIHKVALKSSEKIFMNAVIFFFPSDNYKFYQILSISLFCTNVKDATLLPFIT